ncbi:22262_t:CDS:2, partial [Gigaspora margarita]
EKGVGGEKDVEKKNTITIQRKAQPNNCINEQPNSKPSQIALMNANAKPSQIFALMNEASPIPTGNKNFNNSTYSIKVEQREIKAIFTDRIRNILSSERILSKDKSSLLRNGSYYNLSEETQLSSVESEIYDNESSDFNCENNDIGQDYVEEMDDDIELDDVELDDIDPDDKFQINQQEHFLELTYQINTNKTDLTSDQLLLYHLVKIRQAPNIVQLQGPKQKFRFGMGYAKKALDYAIRADKIDELVNQLENFIEKTKKELFNNQENDRDEIVSNKKLRTIKEITNSAYQELETSKSVIQDNQIRERHCKNCKQTGHYASR